MSNKNDDIFNAVRKGDTGKLMKFIKVGGNINVVNEDGNTLLTLAAINGHYECVEMLLAAGANVNVRNKFGDTPLIYAAYEGHKECVRLLIEAGADITIKNNDGDTAGTFE